MGTADVVEEMRLQYPLSRIAELLESFKGIKAIVIGDAIVDEYHFTIPKGRAIKDPILSVDYVKHEVYSGGILAIANHVSNFVNELTCVTVLGDRDDRLEFIRNAANRNIQLKFFVKKGAPTTVKKRYLNIVRNEKLFKVEYINDAPIPEELERELIEYLKQELPKYDLVLVGDFGHGVLTESVIKLLEEKAKYLAVNAQCNSANLGFNYVTKYHSPAFLTMDVQELRYATADRFSEVPVLIEKLRKRAGFNKFLVTTGREGCCYFNNGRQVSFPAFVMKPQDTVGAGDAVFSVTSLFACRNYDGLIPFIANCAGGIAVSYMGNKEFISKKSLLGFIGQAYGGNMQTH